MSNLAIDKFTGLVIRQKETLQRVSGSKLDFKNTESEGGVLIQQEPTEPTQSSTNEQKQYRGQTTPPVPEHDGLTETQPNGYLNGQVWNKDIPQPEKFENILPLVFKKPKVQGATETLARFPSDLNPNNIPEPPTYAPDGVTVLDPGGYKTTNADVEPMVFLSRDLTQHGLTAVRLIETVYQGTEEVEVVEDILDIECTTPTGFTNGGCDGLTYIEVSFPTECDLGSGFVQGYRAVRNTGLLRARTLQLAPGDTHVRIHGELSGNVPLSYWEIQENESWIAEQVHRVRPDWVPTDAYIDSGDSFYTVNETALLSLSGIAPGEVVWTATSWPSEEYSISGIGNLFMGGGEPVETEQVTPFTLPECLGTINHIATYTDGEPAGTVIGEAFIPVQVEAVENETFVASTEQRDFVRTVVKQEGFRTITNKDWVRFDGFTENDRNATEVISTRGQIWETDLTTFDSVWGSGAIPDEGVHASPGLISADIDEITEPSSHSPVISLPTTDTAYVYFVYEKLTPRAQGTFRALDDPAEFDLEGLDWRRVESNYACRTVFEGDAYVNVNDKGQHFKAEEADVQALLDGSGTVTVPFVQSSVNETDDCITSAIATRQFKAPGLAGTDCTAVAAGPNRVLKKWGRVASA